MPVRRAIVAGQFYESSPQKCLEQIKQLLPKGPIEVDLPKRILAGIVPHAGWVFSGDVAALVLAAIKQQQSVETFVIFGAVHSVMDRTALLYDAGKWSTPLGSVDVDDQFAEAILKEASGLIKANCDAHSREHSIEVQVPIIQHLFSAAKIVPIMVPPTAQAHQVGQAVAQAMSTSEKDVVCIASTDLTHYGPSYGFSPMGSGREAVVWAKETNDRFFIDLALKMHAEEMVESAQMYGSACGAGAAAAAVAGARQLGADRGFLLAHTTSYEIMQEKYGQSSSDSVGYAGIVFG